MNNPTDQPTPPVWQTPPPPPPAPPAPWYKKKWVWGLAAVGVIAIGSAGGGSEKKDAKLATASGQVSETTVTTAAPTTTTILRATTTTEAPTTTTTEAPTTTTKPPAWVKVATIATSSDKQSSTFTVTGEEQRFNYSCAKGTISIAPQCIVNIEPVDGGQGFDLWANKVEADTTSLHLAPGRYYIDASIVGAFTGTLEELR